MKTPMNEPITMFKKQFNFLSMAVHPFPTSELSLSVYHSLRTQKSPLRQGVRLHLARKLLGNGAGR